MQNKKFNIKTNLTSKKLYINLYSFFDRNKEQYLKIIAKIAFKDKNSVKTVSLTHFSYLDLTNKQDIMTYIQHNLNKFDHYLDYYQPISINGLSLDYDVITKDVYLSNKSNNPWLVKEINLEIFPFPLTIDYESLSNNIKKDLVLDNLYHYEDCKGFKDADKAKFDVKTIYLDDKIKIFNVNLFYKKDKYSWTDKFINQNNEITRIFTNNQEMKGTLSLVNLPQTNLKLTPVNNINKIHPITKNGLKVPFLCITLDIETWLDISNPKSPILRLMSVAYFDGNESKFYFISQFKNDKDLIKKLLLDLLKSRYDGYNIYIHNGAKFDLIFLLKNFIYLHKELNFKLEFLYKDGEILNLSIKNKYTKIQIKDSYKILLNSLKNLAKTFNNDTEGGAAQFKGVFPYDFAKPENFNYVGKTPDYKYFGFNGEPSGLPIDTYQSLIKDDWSFVEELKKYNVQDCIILYNVLKNFDLLTREVFNFNMHNNPTLSSLAFSIYRYAYIPDNLQYTEKIGKREYKRSHIDNLNKKYDSFVRNSYFGGHVDSYIPYFNNDRKVDEGMVLNQYDVVSLYPYIMWKYELPYKITHEVKGNILINNKDLFDNSVGFYKTKVIAPKLVNPLLPYKTEKNIVLYGEGEWTGTYYSEEIKNCIKYGYQFEILEGLIFESTNLFDNYINTLFEIKQASKKGTPMYLITKILQNSLYGKFGIHFNLPSYELVNSEEKDKLLSSPFYNVTDVIDFDSIIGGSYDKGYHLISYANSQTLGNVAIASAITAMARVHMSQFLNNINLPVYYMDTDSVVVPVAETQSGGIEIPAEQAKKEQQLFDLVGDDLGKMKLEHTYNKFIALGPKFYGGITKNGESIIKVKGLTKEALPCFSELEILLNKGKDLMTSQTKVFKDLGLGEITLKNLPYLLKPTDNKRDFIYDSYGKIVATKNKVCAPQQQGAASGTAKNII